MMKYVMGILLTLVACNDADKQPHLSKEKMRAILLDINIAESYSSMVRDTINRIGAKNPDSLAAFYKAIFDHHKISREEYETSLAWYKSNPAEMDSLFSSLIPVATAWQDSIKNKKTPKQN
jgi:hypothetical protein